MTESACTIVGDLRARYQGTPILTLAQTGLWDDPLKALVKGILDAEVPGARLVLGIMDTDYFSRLPNPPPGLPPIEVLPHNEGSTRDLWAAVGEMHCLLGAETPLSLHTLAEFGVRLCRVMENSNTTVDESHHQSCVDEFTEAWGWRGLAQTRGRRRLAGDVPLRDAGGPLIRQLEWALAETERVADRPLGPCAQSLRARVAGFVGANPEASLTDVYLDALPSLYEMLLGYAPRGLEYTRSSGLLRFTRWTANRARFRPLDLFLDPATAPLAKRYYNEAVRDGGIATLDRFGPDALPFDVAIPGRGRGTLHIGRDYLHVDTDDPVQIALNRPVTSRRRLAVILEDNLGTGVALLGKAVVLITMLAQEYIFLFNETGSPYVTRSCRWNYLLGREGLMMNLYPIIRLGVKPWDTVSAAGGHLVLPPHMARTFGIDRPSAEDFQAQWRGAAQKAEGTLQIVRRFGKPVEWMNHLAETEAARGWDGWAGEYQDLRAARSQHGVKIRTVNANGEALLESLRRLRAKLNGVEQEKGRHFRACVWPAREAGNGDALAAAMVRRTQYEDGIARLRVEIAAVDARRAELAEQRRALQLDPAVKERAERMRALEGIAEREKAQMVRDAWMTLHALEHTQARPSAWWFPTVDPSGKWFRAVADTAEFRWQSLTGETCAESASAALPAIVSI